MTCDSCYDELTETVAIGRLVPDSRFCSVPHCIYGGYQDMLTTAVTRSMKSQGRWQVFLTEQCEIYHISKIVPSNELRLCRCRDIQSIASAAAGYRCFADASVHANALSFRREVTALNPREDTD